jgi:tetratricopeptide (TPR) repeat protein/DNA-binding XRE family transcriptional regulator
VIWARRITRGIMKAMGDSGDVRDSFGALLRRCRDSAGLTQEELAERSGLTSRTIRDMERGRSARPYSRSVRSLAVALGLAPELQAQLLGAARGDGCAGPSANGPPMDGPAAEPPCLVARLPAAPRRAAIIPRQLPPAARHFTGREAELADLSGHLAREAAPSLALLILCVCGTAGVGKTTLAVQWAHRTAGLFPHGQLYVDLRGFDPSGPPVSAAAAIRILLDALDVAPAAIPASFDAQVGLYRSLLAGRRMLLLLDNARDAEQVRPLLPGSPGCLVMVTSRSPLSSLVTGQGAQRLTLDVMSGADARRLLVSFLGPERVAAEPGAASEIAELCARLPLALSITAARAAANASFRLADLAVELSHMPGRLDRLDAGEATADVRSALSWSYQKLTGPASRLFRLLGIHPGPDVTPVAAASVAGIGVCDARRLLGELLRAQLITEHSPARFRFHDLLRAYAAELACLQETDAERRAATRRMMDHFLHTGRHAAWLLSPARELPVLPAAVPGAAEVELADAPAALAWLTAEHQVLLRTIAQADAAGFDTHAWQLPWVMTDFLDRRGHWRDWAATQETALRAAGRLGDMSGQAHAHRYISRACFHLSSWDEALAHTQAALRLRQQLGDLAGEAGMRLDVCRVLEQQARYRDALDCATVGLQLYRAAGHRVGEAHALNMTGWFHGLLGEYDHALSGCRQALSLSRELGLPACEANTWDSLGYAHQHLGHYPQALSCYQRAVALFSSLGHRYHHAGALVHLGDAQAARLALQPAREAWRQALAILEDLGHADADAVRAQLDRLSRRTADQSARRRGAPMGG